MNRKKKKENPKTRKMENGSRTTQNTNITSENKDMVSATGTVPSLSFGNEIENRSLPLIVLVLINLFPKDSLVCSKL